jgi:hypothetical protein
MSSIILKILKIFLRWFYGGSAGQVKLYLEKRDKSPKIVVKV